jgi:hypothetical protein
MTSLAHPSLKLSSSRRLGESNVKIWFIRLSGVAAGVAGALRVFTSFLPPLTGRAMTLYLIIDVLLLFGCVGLYEFQRVAIRFLETLGLLLEVLVP